MRNNSIISLFCAVVCLISIGCQSLNTGNYSLKEIGIDQEVVPQKALAFYLSFNILDATESSTLIIDRYYWNKFIAVDTITCSLNNDCIYQLNSSFSNGLYRIKLATEKAVYSYFIVNGFQDSTIQLTATVQDFFDGKIKVYPSKENDCLQQTTNLFSEHMEQLNLINKSIGKVTSINKNYYSLKNALRLDLEKEKLKFYQSLKNLHNQCNGTYSFEVVQSHLIKPNRLEDEQLMQKYELDPALLHEQFFKNIDINNVDIIGHPIFWQSLNEYLKTYTGESEKEYMQSVDVIFKNLDNTIISQLVYDYLIQYYLDRDFEKTARYVAQNFSEGCTNTTNIDTLLNNGRYLPSPEIGSVAPELILQNIDHEDFSLNQLSNSIDLLVLFFWKSGCQLCEEKHEIYSRLQEQFKNENIKIIGISVDSDIEKFIKTISSKKQNILYLHDNHQNQLSSYRIKQVPAVYVLDAQQNILIKDINANQLEDFIQKFIHQKNSL